MYLAALDPMSLVRALPGNVAQGIIWGIMALGVYITFRILDFAETIFVFFQCLSDNLTNIPGRDHLTISPSACIFAASNHLCRRTHKAAPCRICPKIFG